MYHHYLGSIHSHILLACAGPDGEQTIRLPLIVEV